ncbi:hypothetical protein niasHT_033465 [Heterodera trifolii]|uniref:Uncharacterized protein n=1 Tax=Heterodera trifolii TaxID=157864 RepID=A0ABD2J2M0_9BILA
MYSKLFGLPIKKEQQTVDQLTEAIVPKELDQNLIFEIEASVFANEIDEILRNASNKSLTEEQNKILEKKRKNFRDFFEVAEEKRRPTMSRVCELWKFDRQICDEFEIVDDQYLAEVYMEIIVKNDQMAFINKQILDMRIYLGRIWHILRAFYRHKKAGGNISEKDNDFLNERSQKFFSLSEIDNRFPLAYCHDTWYRMAKLYNENIASGGTEENGEKKAIEIKNGDAQTIEAMQNEIIEDHVINILQLMRSSNAFSDHFRNANKESKRKFHFFDDHILNEQLKNSIDKRIKQIEIYVENLETSRNYPSQAKSYMFSFIFTAQKEVALFMAQNENGGEKMQTEKQIDDGTALKTMHEQIVGKLLNNKAFRDKLKSTYYVTNGEKMAQRVPWKTQKVGVGIRIQIKWSARSGIKNGTGSRDSKFDSAPG